MSKVYLSLRSKPTTAKLAYFKQNYGNPSFSMSFEAMDQQTGERVQLAAFGLRGLERESFEDNIHKIVFGRGIRAGDIDYQPLAGIFNLDDGSFQLMFG